MGRQLSHSGDGTFPAVRVLGQVLGPALVLFLILAGGCAQVTRPTPAASEIEEAQLAADRRHPYKTYSLERASQVFIRLLATVPQSQGRTYPFLGFNWWLTEGDRVVIDNVWRPSPAADADLRQGDLIVGVNNWPIHPWSPGGTSGSGPPGRFPGTFSGGSGATGMSTGATAKALISCLCRGRFWWP